MGINFDFSGGSLPGGITFIRASIGTYIDGSGILQIASNDVARFNHNPSGGTLLGLLIEPSATNLARQSNTFSTGPWFTTNGGVLTPSVFTSPDGTSDGWSLTSGTGFGGISGSSAQITWAAAQPYTGSVWAKFITGSVDLIFNFNSVSAVSGIGVGASIARLSNTITPGSGTGGAVITFRTGSGTNGIFGLQVELGSVVTSYIPTTTTQVTRAADNAAFTIPSTVSQLTYTFDDNSTQLVSVSPGAYSIPTNLNRPNILSIVGLDNIVPTLVDGFISMDY